MPKKIIYSSHFLLDMLKDILKMKIPKKPYVIMYYKLYMICQ